MAVDTWGVPHAKASPLLSATTLVTFTALPAAATADGEFDANRHPMVGAVVGEFDGVKDWLCSGTLISPTVFLTVGHCTEVFDDYGLEDAWVTFDPLFDPKRPRCSTAPRSTTSTTRTSATAAPRRSLVVRPP